MSQKYPLEKGLDSLQNEWFPHVRPAKSMGVDRIYCSKPFGKWEANGLSAFHNGTQHAASGIASTGEDNHVTFSSHSFTNYQAAEQDVPFTVHQLRQEAEHIE